MIADIESHKKLSPKVTELFLRGRKLIISLVFTSQSYFQVPKTYSFRHFEIKVWCKNKWNNAKCNALFYQENPQQNRTSTNSI